MPTYEFIDRDITAGFTKPGTITPEDAVAQLAACLRAGGGHVIQGFEPAEQNAKADPGYVTADAQIVLPGGCIVWVNIECPHDEAFAEFSEVANAG